MRIRADYPFSIRYVLAAAVACLLCLLPAHASFATQDPSLSAIVLDAPRLIVAEGEADVTADPAPAESPAKPVKHKKKAKADKRIKKTKIKKPASGVAGDAPVSAQDLMQAMRDSLQPPAPKNAEIFIPAEKSAAPAPAVAPPATQPSATVSTPPQAPPSKSGMLFHPAARAEASPAPAPVSVPTVAPTVPAKTPAKAEATKTASNSAPLLSDLEEPPSLLGESNPVSSDVSNPDVSKNAMPELSAKTAEVPGNGTNAAFSKPRPLFSRAKNKGNPDIASPEIPAQTVAPVAETPIVPLPEKAPTAAGGSIISPAAVPPSAIPAVPPENANGAVIFSQKAGEEGSVVPTAQPHGLETKSSFGPEAQEIDLGSGSNSTDEKKEGTEALKKSDAAPNAIEEKPAAATPPVAAPVTPVTVATPPIPPAPQADEIAVPSTPANLYQHAAQPSPLNNRSLSSVVTASGRVLHGSCGAINGVGSATKPAGNFCTQGIPTAIVGTGPWSWECQGENGGTSAACSAPLLINGECGPANGSLSASAPIGALCVSGKASDVTGNGPWYWNCFGDNGGVVAQCVAYTLISGVCGPAHQLPTTAAPQTGLCSSGQQSAVEGEGPWNWTCVGSGEGTTVACSAPLRRDGACGSATTAGALSVPTAGLCAAGFPSVVSGNGPWSWVCSGENGGSSASCGTPVLLNAACGPAHALGVSIRPTDGLCQSGQPGEVTGNGPWLWTCLGDHGGAPANCMAPKRVDGLCGPAHQAGFAEKPDQGLCSTGTPSVVVGAGPWQWSCEGAAGGLSTNCVAQALVHAGCGPAHGVSTTTPPTTGLCESGTPTTVIGSGPWLWTCQGTHGGSAINCMAPLQINGACGASDGLAIASAPTANLCRSGTASSVSGNGPWSWTCAGAAGGISATCQATMLTAQASPPATSPVPAAAPIAPAGSSVAATPGAEVPSSTARAGNECTPTVKRWTITCQQGGYPTNYTGVIVGETQVLCPTGVERGVWLSNSCAPATNSAPVSPSPGQLEVPPPPKLPSVTDMLPPVISKIPAENLQPRKTRLLTPRFQDNNSATDPVDNNTSIAFTPGSEGLDTDATRELGDLADRLRGNQKSILTLNAYAAMPADGNQQESRRMALARALAARSYLMRRGIASSRIDIRALGPAGDGKPDDRVDILVK